jgi:KDO2-lipid IV(A) lauroyltransferase
VRAFPPGIRHAAAAPGGSAWYWLSRGQRRAALDNYAAVLGRDRLDPEVARVARRAFQNYGRTLTDFVLLGGLTPAELLERVTLEGREHLDGALAGGRGAILAGLHMGSWDVSLSYAGALGYHAVAVTERFPGTLNDAVVQSRERFGVKVIMLGRAAVRTLMATLQSNGLVGLICDLQQGPGVEVKFFGRRAIVPGGPAALALKMGAPLMPVYQYPTSPGRHHIHVDPPLKLSDTESKESVMQRVIDRFQQFIHERPDQWFAFRPMFKS